MVCDGPAGKFFEVTPDKDIIWDYENPYPNFFQNAVFKINYYTPPDEPPSEVPDLESDGFLRWGGISTNDTVHGSFEIQNIGGNSSSLKWRVVDYPDWGNWTIDPIFGEGLTPDQGSIDVHVSIEVPDVSNRVFEGLIRIENEENEEDFDTVPVYLKTSRNKFRAPYLYHLSEHPFLNLIFNLLMKFVDN